MSVIFYRYLKDFIYAEFSNDKLFYVEGQNVGNGGEV